MEFENDNPHFYKADVKIISSIFLYLNNDKEIYNVKSFKEFITNSRLTNERLIDLIKKHQYNGAIKHKLVGMFTYTIDLNSDEIGDLINYKKEPGTVSPIRYLNGVTFDDTLQLFEDLNSVYFIFSDTNTNTNHTTNTNHHKSTKRIQITTVKAKKTKRKYT